MRELSLEEVRSIQLDILKDVADFCDKNDLTYFLCGGTLLGAVRHEGYIPWDDDIDLMMPRSDYDRFNRIFEIGDLNLYHYNKIKNYNFPFIKISDSETKATGPGTEGYEIGVNIDIFPIDGFPTSKIFRNIHINRVVLMRKILAYKKRQNNYNSLFKKLFLIITNVIMFFLSEKQVLRRMTKLCKKHQLKTSTYAGITVWGYGKREVCLSSVFKKQTEVLFEDCHFKSPQNYDNYLSNVYGDYMKPVQPRGRTTYHNLRYHLKTCKEI